MEMEQNNINWQVGDVAICVNTGMIPGNKDSQGLPPLRLKCEYVVGAVRQCECGSIALDVGLYTPKDGGTTCSCGAIGRPGMHIHWASATRFVKKRTRAEVEAEIEEAIDCEEYKYAQVLQDELDNMKS